MFTDGAGRAADQGAARVPPSTRFQPPFGCRWALVLFVISAVAVAAIFVFLAVAEDKADLAEPGSAERFLQGNGPKDTEPFQLTSGVHRIAYRTSGADCAYAAALHPEVIALFSASTSNPSSSVESSGTSVIVEKSGEHFVRMATGPSCHWEIEIRSA